MGSKGNTDILYALIMSLTKTEKAYFKKYASRHKKGVSNKYIMLFDAIARCRNGYNEKELKRKFYTEKFVKNFSVIKYYLYRMILHSLSNYYSDSNPDNEIKNEIRYVEILYKRSLFKNCKHIIRKALKSAYKSDNFLLIQELLKWKKNLIFEGVYGGNAFLNLEKVYHEEQEIISKIKNLSDYRMLYYYINSLILGTNPNIREKNTKKEYIKILNHPLLQSEKKALSHPALLNYWYILGSVYEALQKNIEALECRKRLIMEMENNREALRENITNYIVFICDLLNSLLTLKLYDESEDYFRKLKTLDKTFPGRITDNERRVIFVGSASLEVKLYISRGDFSELIKNLPGIESGIKKFKDIILIEDVHYFFYQAAYAFFATGNFEKSLEWINKVLNDSTSKHEIRLFIKSKIISLISHYELGNYLLLDYLIKSTHRFFKTSKFINRDEIIVIEMLRKLSRVTHKDQIIKICEEYLKRLSLKTAGIKTKTGKSGNYESESRNSFDNEVEFDLESWLESMVSGKSFEKIVKQKRADL